MNMEESTGAKSDDTRPLGRRLSGTRSGKVSEDQKKRLGPFFRIWGTAEKAANELSSTFTKFQEFFKVKNGKTVTVREIPTYQEVVEGRDEYMERMRAVKMKWWDFLKTYAQKCMGKDDCSLFQLKGLPKEGLEDALYEATAKHGLLVLAWAVGQGFSGSGGANKCSVWVVVEARHVEQNSAWFQGTSMVARGDGYSSIHVLQQAEIIDPQDKKRSTAAYVSGVRGRLPEGDTLAIIRQFLVDKIEAGTLADKEQAKAFTIRRVSAKKAKNTRLYVVNTKNSEVSKWIQEAIGISPKISAFHEVWGFELQFSGVLADAINDARSAERLCDGDEGRLDRLLRSVRIVGIEAEGQLTDEQKWLNLFETMVGVAEAWPMEVNAKGIMIPRYQVAETSHFAKWAERDECPCGTIVFRTMEQAERFCQEWEDDVDKDAFVDRLKSIPAVKALGDFKLELRVEGEEFRSALLEERETASTFGDRSSVNSDDLMAEMLYETPALQKMYDEQRLTGVSMKDFGDYGLRMQEAKIQAAVQLKEVREIELTGKKAPAEKKAEDVTSARKEGGARFYNLHPVQRGKGVGWTTNKPSGNFSVVVQDTSSGESQMAVQQVNVVGDQQSAIPSGGEMQTQLQREVAEAVARVHAEQSSDRNTNMGARMDELTKQLGSVMVAVEQLAAKVGKAADASDEGDEPRQEEAMREVPWEESIQERMAAMQAEMEKRMAQEREVMRLEMEKRLMQVETAHREEMQKKENEMRHQRRMAVEEYEQRLADAETAKGHAMAKMQNCNDQFALSALKLESERQEARIAVLKPVIEREVKLLELAGEKRIRAVAGGDGKGEESQMVVYGSVTDGERAAQRQKGSGAEEPHQSPC